MDERINPADEAEHRNAQLHLPWYATGRLDAAEQARVAMHVAGCAVCQAELALEGALAAHEPELPALSANAGWARLKARLDRDRRPTPAMAAARGAVPALFGDWRGWAMAAQFAIIVLLTIFLTRAPQSPDYRALGRTQSAPAGELIVMFGPQTPERTMRAVLDGAGARIIDGPTVTGAYVLKTQGGGQQLALARLRKSPAVTMAEPLATETSP
jgi:hypothetical protein